MWYINGAIGNDDTITAHYVTAQIVSPDAEYEVLCMHARHLNVTHAKNITETTKIDDIIAVGTIMDHNHKLTHEQAAGRAG